MKNTAHHFWLAFILLLSAIALSVMVGSVFIPPKDFFATLWQGISGTLTSVDSPWAAIIFKLRLPRTVLMGLTGAALASSGAAYQGIFRNPLADPYVIGVASGAGLGAVIAMTMFRSSQAAAPFFIPTAAFAAGLLTAGLVFALAHTHHTSSSAGLILAGVAISSFTNALTSFVILKSTNEMRRAMMWMMGGSSLSGWQPVLAMLPYVIPGIGLLLTMGYSLNVMQFGEEQAQQLGLNIRQRRFIIVAASSLATAAAVSFTGIIGFVGLIIPHIIRMWDGSDYRRILPLSCLGGAAFLLLADVLARVILAPQEIPPGIITALTGAPFFIWILRRSQKEQE